MVIKYSPLPCQARPFKGLSHPHSCVYGEFIHYWKEEGRGKKMLCWMLNFCSSSCALSLSLAHKHSVSLWPSFFPLPLTNLHNHVRSAPKWSAKCWVLLKGNRLEQCACFAGPVKATLAVPQAKFFLMNYYLLSDDSSLHTDTRWAARAREKVCNAFYSPVHQRVKHVHRGEGSLKSLGHLSANKKKSAINLAIFLFCLNLDIKAICQVRHQWCETSSTPYTPPFFREQ